MLIMISATPGGYSDGESGFDKIQGRALWDTGYRFETHYECRNESWFSPTSFCYDSIGKPLASGRDVEWEHRQNTCEAFMGMWEKACLPVKKGFNPVTD
jgi:hypothetical protein